MLFRRPLRIDIATAFPFADRARMRRCPVRPDPVGVPVRTHHGDVVPIEHLKSVAFRALLADVLARAPGHDVPMPSRTLDNPGSAKAGMGRPRHEGEQTCGSACGQSPQDSAS
jgi:hypothetical protein